MKEKEPEKVCEVEVSQLDIVGLTLTISMGLESKYLRGARFLLVSGK